MNVDDLRGLAQPDQRSCGPSSVVAARMLVDPAYRPTSFSREVLTAHRQLTAPVLLGRTQLPWPQALGTPPWAVARALSSYTSLPYRTRVVRLGDRSAAFSVMLAHVAAGRPVPVYVGSPGLPRHVVLAAAPAPGQDGVRVYNPAHGTLDVMTREAFTAGRLTTTGRWRTPWFVVCPA